MSLTSSLSHALSGLTVAARRAEVIASNIGGAGQAGHVPRRLEVAARDGGGAVAISVQRLADPALIAQRRAAEAASAGAGVRAGFMERLDKALGIATDTGLAARTAALEAAALAASADPGETRLAAVLQAAQGLAGQVAGAARDIRAAVTEADRRLTAEVATLNQGLARVEALNARIAARGAGEDTSALQDLRQAEIDRMAAILPLREMPMRDGRVGLLAAGGAVLLQDRAVPIAVTAEGLRLAGVLQEGPALRGGTLSALLDLRDSLAPQALARLDGLAGAMVDRAGGLLRAGPPGPGMAARLSVAPAFDPAQGGALWLLRDGPDATTPGPAQYGSRLAALAASLAEGADRPALTRLAAEVEGLAAEARGGADREAAFTTARLSSLRETEARGGVDRDAELQALLQVEQAHAANARVLRAVDEMLKTLVGI